MMDLFKTIFLCLFIIAPSSPISAAPQTGSSFFYYYSPNQPMVVNSQTFGSNPQAYHHTGKPGTNPFDFIPSDQTNNQNLGNFPGTNPFLPRNTNSYQSSLLDKIAFTHGPPRPVPTPTQQPALNSQYNYDNYRSNPGPTPTPTPSPKLFNFLNQPFQFFQNGFGRFQNQPQQEVYNEPEDDNQQQNYVQPNAPQSGREYVTPPRLTSHLPPLPSPTEQSRQNFYTYYDTGAVPSRFTSESPKTTPLTFSVQQYFTAKTTKGPASYTFTIEANPTVGPRPTAQVHVSVGSDTLPATFPTLPASLFVRPSGESRNETSTSTLAPVKEEENQNQVTQEEMQDYEDNAQPVVATTTTPQPQPTPNSTTTEDTVLQPEVSEVELQLELVPPALAPEHETEPPTLGSTSTTPEPETTPTSTTITTSTTTTPIPTINIEQDSIVRGRRPVKRVIVRKKLATGERVRLSESDLRNIAAEPQQNELPILEKAEGNFSSPSQTTEIILPSIRRPNKRPALTSTTTTTPTTTSMIPTTSTTTTTPELYDRYAPAASVDVPTTFRYNSVDFNFKNHQSQLISSLRPSSFDVEPTKEEDATHKPITTTGAPLLLTTPKQNKVPQLSPNAAIKQDIVEPGVNNDYEYYYYDDQEESSTSTQAPTTRSTSTTTIPTTTEPPLSSTTTELSSTTEIFVDADHQHNLQATTIPTWLLEEELIEPLSTTEEPISSSTPESSEQSTEKVATTTERILITTYRPSQLFSESEPEIRTSTTSTTTTPKPEPMPDYDASPGVDVGGGESFPGVDSKDEEQEKNTDPTPSKITGNETLSEPIHLQVSNLTSLPDNSSHPLILTEDFHPDEYFSSQEEYIAPDPLEDERIHEAQRHALNTALKNIRNRQQNSSTTEKPTEDENSKIKYIRKPTKVNPFPVSTSVSVSFSSHEVEDEELGDSRTNIINKIQTFKTKLRKVVNRTGRKFSTTKRPRWRVTRPTSPTTQSLPELEHLVENSTIAEIEVPQQRSVGGSKANVVDVVEKVEPEPATSTTTTSTTTSTIAPLTSVVPVVTPRVLVDSLIITEILPTTTQPSTTTTTEPIDDQEPIDFETEDQEISSSTTSTTRITTRTQELSPTTETPSLAKVNPTNETVIVETSTSRSIRERKVKVILKRRKGAPKGTGTVARQVVRTRTRVLKQEDDQEISKEIKE